jgi:hypothetical protein
MEAYLTDVPPELRERCAQIVAVTDKFCGERLTDEYRDLCRDMAVDLCQPGTPVAKGKPSGWAAGIVYSIGWVNFLTDPSQEPHATAAEIAQGCGVSEATMHARSRELREGFELAPFEPTWSLPSRAHENPYLQIAAGLAEAGLLPPGIEFDPESGTISLGVDPEELEQLGAYMAEMLEQVEGLEPLPDDALEPDVLGFQLDRPKLWPGGRGGA